MWLSNVDFTNLGNVISLISSSMYFKCVYYLNKHCTNWLIFIGNQSIDDKKYVYLCLFKKLQFVKTFLSQQTTIINNFFKIISNSLWIDKK